jgi:REP element-mobilizing transposase RayT
LALFARVFHETKQRFVFQIRGLQLADDGLRFYIKPAEGLQLPAIMKWMKQVFAQRYNRAARREGHIWGDRYGSKILEGEPPDAEDAETGVRPYYGETRLHHLFPSVIPLFLAWEPG